jgi:hypothetical protein
MCEGYSLAVMAALAVATSAVTAYTSYEQQNTQNKIAQENAMNTQKANDKNFEMYQAEADTAASEKAKAYGKEVEKSRREYERYASTLRTLTGEAGVTGSLPSTLLSASLLKTATDIGTLESSKESALDQIQYEKMVAKEKSKSPTLVMGNYDTGAAIASVGLTAASEGVKAYSTYQTNKAWGEWRNKNSGLTIGR